MAEQLPENIDVLFESAGTRTVGAAGDQVRACAVEQCLPSTTSSTAVTTVVPPPSSSTIAAEESSTSRGEIGQETSVRTERASLQTAGSLGELETSTTPATTSNHAQTATEAAEFELGAEEVDKLDKLAQEAIRRASAEELPCFCREENSSPPPQHRNYAGVFIKCDECGRWCHAHCANLTYIKARQLGRPYVCKPCGGEQYVPPARTKAHRRSYDTLRQQHRDADSGRTARAPAPRAPTARSDDVFDAAAEAMGILIPGRPSAGVTQPRRSATGRMQKMPERYRQDVEKKGRAPAHDAAVPAGLDLAPEAGTKLERKRALKSRAQHEDMRMIIPRSRAEERLIAFLGTGQTAVRIVGRVEEVLDARPEKLSTPTND